MSVLYFIILILAAYLLGSLSFAYWVGRLHGVDLRQHGSGNIGATNAGRTLGKRWFFIVFFVDVAKGLVPVLLVKCYAPQLSTWDTAPLLLHILPISVALAAILGHSFTCFHGFKGGKAVATSLGVLLALIPLVAALCLVVWIIAWFIISKTCAIRRSDAVGPASILASIACPIIFFSMNLSRGEHPLQMPVLANTILVCLICCLVLVRHRSNARKFLAVLVKQKNTPKQTDNA